MLKSFFKKQMRAFGRRWNYDVSYMIDIIDRAGVRAIMPMQAVQKISGYRRGVPKGVYFAAGLAGAVRGDCGPCAQLGVSMALAQGIDPALVRNIVSGNRDALPSDVALAYDLAVATLARDPACVDLSNRVRERFGEEGLVSLAYAIVASQIYPTFKYAIGHGHACRRLVIGDLAVEPVRESLHAHA